MKQPDLIEYKKWERMIMKVLTRQLNRPPTAEEIKAAWKEIEDAEGEE